jgi:cold shock CspA family protein
LDRQLLISAGPGEWRAALLETGVPVELFVERGDRSEAGSIHLSRVARLLPALGAALVDIGGGRPAFLPQSEVLPRGRRLHEGERVVVQVRREAQAGKAARVTMAATVRGRLVELIVGRPGSADGAALLTQLAPTPTLPRCHGGGSLIPSPASGGGLGWGRPTDQAVMVAKGLDSKPVLTAHAAIAPLGWTVFV